MMNFDTGIVPGAFLIVMYAAERFSTPRTTRTSTTAFRYYAAFTSYVLAYLLTFLFFIHYPSLLKQLVQDPKLLNVLGAADASSRNVVVALTLAILVPKIPLISALDRRLQQGLHKLALIPAEVNRLSKVIRELPFEIPVQLEEKLQQEIVERHFPIRLKDIREDDPIASRWLHIAALVLQLKQWEKENPFAIFTQERSGQLHRIYNRYHLLSSAAVSAHQVCTQAAEQPEVQSLQDIANRFSRNLHKEALALYWEICEFISHAILASCLRAQSRRTTLEQLGFKLPEQASNRVESLSIHQVAALALLLVVMLTASFILLSQLGAGDTLVVGKILRIVVMIVAIYSMAVFLTVSLKSHWAWFRHRPDRFYPVAGYVATGLLAMSCAALINLVFTSLIYLAGPEVSSFAEAVGEAWTRFSQAGYPWLVMSFVAAGTLSFLIDWEPVHVSGRGRRLLEAAIMALVLMAGANLVYLWVADLFASRHEQLPMMLPEVLFNSALIGSVIGYLVPAWFNRQLEAEESQSARDSLAPALG